MKIDNTRFEVYVSNSKRNDLQNVTGRYGSFADSTFTDDICSAGFLCVTAGKLPLEGYSAFGMKNANSHYMVTAANGLSSGYEGDHTGLYFCNTYDVNKLSDGVVTVNFAGRTLGLAVPAGELADYTEAIVGESYNLGSGNFSTLPTDLSATPYATITNGLLVASANKPTDGSVYFDIENISDRYVEGAYDGGQKITVKCRRSVVAAVTYTAQTLTTGEKTQARTNIGAAAQA